MVAADEVIERGGEQAFGKVVRLPCVAEAVDGGGDVRQVERGLRQRVVRIARIRPTRANVR